MAGSPDTHDSASMSTGLALIAKRQAPPDGGVRIRSEPLVERPSLGGIGASERHDPVVDDVNAGLPWG